MSTCIRKCVRSVRVGGVLSGTPSRVGVFLKVVVVLIPVNVLLSDCLKAVKTRGRSIRLSVLVPLCIVSTLANN